MLNFTHLAGGENETTLRLNTMINLGTLIPFILLTAPMTLCSQVYKAEATAYGNFADFKAGIPKCTVTFKFDQMGEKNYYNVYYVRSGQKRVSRKEINYGIWIIVERDNLYLNAARQGFQQGYIRFIQGGSYYYFTAERYQPLLPFLMRNSETYYTQGSMAGFGNSVPASVQYGMSLQQNKDKIHHVFDLKNGNTFILSKETMQYLLQEYPVLLKQFESTENNDDLTVLKAYLEIVDSLESEEL